MKIGKLVLFVSFFTLVKGALKFYRLGSTEYALGAVVKDRDEATKKCEAERSWLATIKTKAVFEFVISDVVRRIEIEEPYAWHIGAKRVLKVPSLDSYFWLDNISVGSTFSRVQYNERFLDECLFFISSSTYGVFFYFKSDYCHKEAKYICERQPEHIRITALGVVIRHQSYEYFFGPSVDNFGDAISYCNKLVGIPVVIHNATIRNLVAQEIRYTQLSRPPYSFFIGLKRITTATDNSAFEWLDGVRLTSNSFTSWDRYEPNFDRKNEWCVVCGLELVIDNFLWRDQPCFKRARVLCQLPYVESKTNTEFLPFGERYEYHIGHPVSNYTQAEAECKSRHARLAILRTWEEQEFIINQTTFSHPQAYPYSFYFGLRRFGYENNNLGFKWIDDSQLRNESVWAEGEPNNKGSNERCVIMGSIYTFEPWEMTWKDIDCSLWSRFVCQRLQEGQVEYDYIYVDESGQPTKVRVDRAKEFSISDLLNPGWILAYVGTLFLLIVICMNCCVKSRMNKLSRRLEHTEQENHLQLELICKRREIAAGKEIKVEEIRASVYFDPIGTKDARKKIQKAAAKAAKRNK